MVRLKRGGHTPDTFRGQAAKGARRNAPRSFGEMAKRRSPRSTRRAPVTRKRSIAYREMAQNILDFGFVLGRLAESSDDGIRETDNIVVDGIHEEIEEGISRLLQSKLDIRSTEYVFKKCLRDINSVLINGKMPDVERALERIEGRLSWLRD